MSKRTVGLVAGLAVASVALAAPLSSAMASGTPSPAVSPAGSGSSATAAGTVPGAGGTGSSAAKAGASAVPAQRTTAGVAAVALPGHPGTRVTTSAGATTRTALAVKPAPKPAPKPVVPKIVRLVRLELPTSATVGSNVSGFIQVLDDNGQIQSPVPNVDVAFQRKDGARWTDLSEDLTDVNGVLPVAFMSQMNMTVRAVYRPAHGAVVASKQLLVTSASQVTWAARPDMDVAAKKTVTYAFRINSGVVPTAHLEFASTDKPGKWTSGKSVAVAATGVAKAGVAFPGPGTYLLRGTTGKSATNAAGYTSTITVTVS